MFCTNCGAILDPDTNFCTACGCAVEAGSANVQATPVSQASQDNNGRKKVIALVIIIGVLLGLLAALLAFTMCSNRQAISTSSSTTSSSTSNSTSSSTVPEEQLSPEEAAVKALDGWWAGWYHRPGYFAAYANIHDSVIDWYFYNPDIDAVEYSSTVDIVKADQFDENGAKGWRFFPSTAVNEAFAYYQAEGDEDNLPIYMTANGYGNIDPNNYNTDSPERFGITRITDAEALDADGVHSKVGFEQAQALAKERGVTAASAEKTGSASSSKETPFDQAKAEAEARAAAEAAGKQIFTGTVYVQDEATRSQELNTGRPSGGYANHLYVFLVLDTSQTVTAKNADGATIKQEPYRTRDGVVSVLLSSDYSPDFSSWAAYEGQKITIAASQDEMGWFSDATGALFNVGALNPEVIAPITEDMAKAREKAQEAANSPDAYVLADSATKAYSRSELEALDNHTLFLARNEIYARHGRGFKNQELRDYFGGKAWYKETVSSEAFSENVLNGTEKANANLMLEIEKSRNSPYIQ